MNSIPAGLTAKDMAMNILKDTGCDAESYQGVALDIIISDLKTAFPDGIKYGFSYKEIAEAIYAISTTDRGWKEPIQYEIDGPYASHYGATDLYESIEKDLRKLVACGEPFKTCSLNSQKELYGWRMERTLAGGPISVTVNQWMDEGQDLVYDALPDDVELSDDQIDEILDAWIFGCDGASETSETAVVPGDSSLDDILKKVTELLGETDSRLNEWFELMKGTVQEYLKNME